MTKTFPTLYSRTSTGAIQEWTIFAEDGKHWTVSGQQDGKKVSRKPTIAKPKNVGRANETTAVDQAIIEAQSVWDKKMKTGYTDDITKVDTCITYIEPMLAKNLKDRVKKIDWKKGLLVQNKFNGNRAIANRYSIDVHIKTRKGEFWLSIPHINRDLQEFFTLFPDAVLDGELFNNDLRQRLNELSEIVRKTKNITEEDYILSEKMVRFYVYDGFGFTDELTEDAPYEARKAWIDQNLPKYSKYFRSVETELVHSMDELEKIFQRFVADGQEGIIARVPGSPYEIGARSAYLLKYKPCDDAEAIILELKEGLGDWAGTAKTASILWEGKVFDATFKGSIEQAQERLKHPELWVNKKVTFLYNGLTGLGIPNFARIDPNNCFSADR